MVHTVTWFDIVLLKSLSHLDIYCLHLCVGRKEFPFRLVYHDTYETKLTFSFTALKNALNRLYVDLGTHSIHMSGWIA